MPFTHHDVRHLSYLTLLDQGLSHLNADVSWDLRPARLVLRTWSASIGIRADFRQGRWIYTWGPWPWHRVDADHEDVADQIYRAMGGM